MHQPHMPMPSYPASMHVAGVPPGHFLPSPALASPVGSSSGSQPPNPPLAANAPCSTLFVANLGQFVSEHELKEIFASLPGFCRLRMHTKQATLHHHQQQQHPNQPQHNSQQGIPVAFVEFRDAKDASSAMAALQGTFLLSSDRGAIRIEYAKSKMAVTDHPAQHHPALASREGSGFGHKIGSSSSSAYGEEE